MKTLKIDTPSCRSVIYCGRGAFEERAPLLKGQQLFVVTDSNVYALYSDLILSAFGQVPVYVLPAGERSKNLTKLKEILTAMLTAGVTRSCTVVAFGGGVVGDIAGLAAALYMRGVRLVQIPTTLLAQVDSSVGGKTAVDFGGVKNAVGTFYQPGEVIVDPRFLSTLPIREIKCGLGEIVKYGALNGAILDRLIDCPDLFDLCFLEGITYDCIAHKARVVEADERDEGGARATLNVGHTTGHAFELYYKRLSHGQFVLIGMYYELYLAQKSGCCGEEYADVLRDLIVRVLGRVPAPVDAAEAAARARYDKKNEQNTRVTMIVPVGRGQTQKLTLPVARYCALIGECAAAIKEKAK